jgi:uncharacterized protein YodC (DUF2158 family)
MNFWPRPAPDNVPGASQFQCGDKVRTLHGSGLMTVVLALGDQVHCEWLIGTERQQRAFPARVLRLVFRGEPRAQ